jgi:hypothetical protein
MTIILKVNRRHALGIAILIFLTVWLSRNVWRVRIGMGNNSPNLNNDELMQLCGETLPS